MVDKHFDDDQVVEQLGASEVVQRPLKRRGLLKGGIAVGATMLSAAFTLTPFTPVQAASVTTQTLPDINPVQSAIAQELLSKVLSTPGYKAFVAKIEQTVPHFPVQLDEASAWQIEGQSQQDFLVRIPVAGGAGSSFYVAVLSSSRSIITTQSALFDQAGPHQTRALAWHDGRLTLDAVISDDGKSINGTLWMADGSKKKLTTTLAQTLLQNKTYIHPNSSETPLCCFISGLVVYGFASVPVALAAALVCAVICVGTLGFGCLACIAAYVGISTAAIAFLKGRCDRNPNSINIGIC